MGGRHAFGRNIRGSEASILDSNRGIAKGADVHSTVHYVDETGCMAFVPLGGPSVTHTHSGGESVVHSAVCHLGANGVRRE